MISGGFGQYILSIVGAVILTTVADIIMPEGKIAKYVKNVLSIFLVLIIISPVSKLLSKDIDFNSFFNYDNVQTDYSFINALNKEKVDALEKSAENHLKSKGYGNIKVNILYTGNTEGVKVDFVHADLTNFEFPDKGEHIYIIDNIIKCLSEFLKISKEKIYIYGAD